MPFKKIMVALDGSQYSQIAADYAFWLAGNLGAEVSAQHVIDPRLVDLFIAPEFAEELGFGRSIDTADKVLNALRRIGNVILELFATEASGRGLRTTTFLDEGYIADEIVKYAEEFDLVVMGHRGQGRHPQPAELMIGSVAERVAIASSRPVLITAQPVASIKQILVAYDGSESARGALRMAETLALETDTGLKAVTVVSSAKQAAESEVLIEQGQKYLREKWDNEVFSIKEGAVADTLLDYASASDSLLVIGAYGFDDSDKNVLGKNTTRVIRQAKTTVLIYRPALTSKMTHELERLRQVTA